MEVGIKASLGKADVDVDPMRLLAAARFDLIELPVTSEAADRVANLPRHHRDPFDPFLVAQAIDADAVLLTADAALPVYGDHILPTT